MEYMSTMSCCSYILNSNNNNPKKTNLTLTSVNKDFLCKTKR